MISKTMTWLGILLSFQAVALAQPAPTVVPEPARSVAEALESGPKPAESTVSATTPSTTGHALTAADVDAWLDGFMPFALRRSDIPGAVVAVVKDGQVVTQRGFGYADLEKRTPVDPERTLFRPGSVSKLVTWTAVMQQVERGKLDLDRDVNEYLDFKIPARKGQPVTLRQVLTHTAGFEEQAKDILFYDVKNIKPMGDLLKNSMPARIYDAGTTPAYSNWATTLAGYIVERVSGMPFDDYVEKEIFQPLGMRYATFRQPLPEALAAQMSSGYPRAGQGAKPFEIIGPAPAGSLSASGADMARFMLAHLNGGELDGQRILSAETAATMHDSPLDRIDPHSLIPPLNRMELGFFETNINGREVIAHLGDTSAFHTSLHLFMDEGVGLYVSFNSSGKEGAAGVVRSELFQQFADRYFPDLAPAAGTVDAATAKEHAAQMAGVWENSRRSDTNYLAAVSLLGQVKVAVDKDGNLLIPDLKNPSGSGPRKWVEVAPYVWQDRTSHDRLAAQVENGRIVRWSFDMLSPFMVFDRVPTRKSSVWIVPVLCIALPVLALTLLSWPIGWWNRRRYKTPLALTGTSLRLYRWVRIASGLVLAALATWALVVTRLFGDLDNATSKTDGLLRLAQVFGFVAFVGGVLVAAWNVIHAWRDRRGWPARIWSLLLLFSFILILYVAITFHLIGFSVKY